MKKFFSIVLFLTGISFVQAQVGIGTKEPDNSAMLEVKSSSKGMLIPRMTQSQRNAIKNPANSLMIYQTDNTPGYYYFASGTWTRLANGNTTGSGLTFNAPLSQSGSIVSIPQANATTNGFLSAADWNKFNKVENGTNTGDMLYWNGNSWVKLAAPSVESPLVFCDGLPTWGGCLAVLSTSSATDITATTATAGGTLTKTGGTAILDKGIVWSTTANPTISLTTKKSFGSGSESFSGTISGLEASTVYYARAYATNSKGTSYGNEISFTTTAVDLTTGLVAYYPFNGNANDESGNGNHGTVNGVTLTTDRNGLTDKAFQFNGYNEIVVPHSQQLNLIGDMTISAWFLSEGPPTFGTNHTIVCKRSNSDFNNLPFDLTINYQYGIPTDYKKPMFITAISFPNDYQFLQSSTDVTNNVWQHIAATVSSNTLKIYLNGTEVLNTSINNSLRTSNTSPVLIGSGARLDKPVEQFVGKLDDIRIYNRALTQSEITYLATH